MAKGEMVKGEGDGEGVERLGRFSTSGSPLIEGGQIHVSPSFKNDILVQFYSVYFYRIFTYVSYFCLCLIQVLLKFLKYGSVLIPFFIPFTLTAVCF